MATQIPIWMFRTSPNDLVLRFFSRIFRFPSLKDRRWDSLHATAREKSTLMSVLMDKEGYESGSIIYRRDLKLGFLEQSPQFDPEESVLDACFNHKDDPEKVLKARQILTQLHITNWSSPWDS